ncbi:MAG TPA: N-6 DNA methylase, partial [Candidatus Obscuribacter sp.]|nr:N-6 DNA methylase [Candidatus Obscuribacter sp.]
MRNFFAGSAGDCESLASTCPSACPPGSLTSVPSARAGQHWLDCGSGDSDCGSCGDDDGSCGGDDGSCDGDCGSGESEIRRWVLENDWLDCIVMLPDQLFYNTGIFTYVWLLRNEKPESHRGKVMIIDARKQFEKEPKSFGNKRNRIADIHRQWI